MKTNQLAKEQEVMLNKSAAGHCPSVAFQLDLAARPACGELLLVHQDGALLIQLQFRLLFLFKKLLLQHLGGIITKSSQMWFSIQCHDDYDETPLTSRSRHEK